jgi:glutamyl-tRNA synthetase
MKEIRVRFAPSPTGYLHVGGARTALFDWLFARHQVPSGKFILRIEDTDIGRSSPEMTEGILEAMRWLGLDWDEGPFYQSRRLELYRQVAQKLLDAGSAYRCYCAPGSQETQAGEQSRDPAERDEGAVFPPSPEGAVPRPPRDPCRARRRDHPAGPPFAIRFLVPDEGVTSFDDAVYGRLDFTNAELEDFVLLRSDGMPTYHLSVVADDIDMRMTHIVRGADHLSNTPKQVLLYQALGAALPVFAHLPLILGPDRTRLSKRHGATSVTAYRDQGLLPDAFRNFLALLGWNPGDDREILSAEELIQAFSLEGISKSNAVFNPEKLRWFNQQYIQRCSAEQLLPHVREELKRAGWWKEEYETGPGREWLLRAIELPKPRMRSIKDFPARNPAFFSDDYAIDPEAAAKFWKDPALAQLLPALAERLEGVEPFDAAGTEAALRAFAGERGVKAGLLINASRVALTGQGVAPGIFEVMALLGRARSVARLRRAVSRM